MSVTPETCRAKKLIHERVGGRGGERRALRWGRYFLNSIIIIIIIIIIIMMIIIIIIITIQSI